ncbi:FKBP-type peptidyl-prolyl cis-trans isomerase [Mesonia ostreae]|uniref:Peptidyl-prolyl cis-trans isomerase n=1 Tax=Mesonia ostreae TaxID=861110 RepID=A0ABU2KK47_9FLAO|nr:FKBP-type peptidyl-prolyl cis-trans isomerase [Mesonia ostreae]MDT0295098.1 hypothetical protein [Mesonia ostreae]
MKYKLIFTLIIAVTMLASCNDDDDGGNEIPKRDRGEVAVENEQQILEFLETHSYRMTENPANPNYQLMVFDTIAEDNAGGTPLIDSPFLKSKTVSDQGIDYTLYYLQVRKGAESEYQPTFADRVIVTYKGELLDGEPFDQSINPTNFNLPDIGNGGFITGFIEGVSQFKGASGFVNNEDGTISYNDDFGIGAVFIPSGLGYFAEPPITSPILAYESLIFSFQLYKGIQLDHDNDGIPSYMEDLNNDSYLLNDDTDGDRFANFSDKDDDGDGVPTIDEIEVNDANGDGWISPDEITFPDSNGNGKPDYLDPSFP